MLKEELITLNQFNDEGIELTLRYLPSTSNTAIFLVPGFGGTYNKISRYLSDYAKENNFAFLFGQFQDSYDKRDSRRLNPNGSTENIKIGAFNSRFASCYSDYRTFFNFLESEGYTNVIPVSFCMGASKTFAYFNKEGLPDSVHTIITVSPQDFSFVKDKPSNTGLFEEAMENMRHHEPHKILSKRFGNYMDIETLTFLEVTLSKNINTLPYLSRPEDLKFLSGYDLPLHFIIGSQDNGIGYPPDEQKAHKCMKILKSFCTDATYSVILGARHLYDGLEDKLIEEIDNHIKSTFQVNTKVPLYEKGEQNVK